MNHEEDDIERFEEERELELYREYRDIVGMFAYVVETERRFYLANSVELNQREDGWVEVILGDAWVWDMVNSSRTAGVGRSAHATSDGLWDDTLARRFRVDG